MFALDLFNTDHERRIAEGAVDQLEQRRIDDLAMKMDDLVARAKTATTAEVKAALMKEFQKCKAERDSYHMVRNETMGYGDLGEQDQIPVGRMQPGTSEYAAARNRSVKYADPKPNYAGGHKTSGPATVGYKKTTNKPLVPSELEVAEAGIGQDVVNKTEKMARATPSTPTSKVASTVKNAAKWLAGKGGPGREGPTYEGQDDAWQKETSWRQIPKSKSGRPVDPRGEVTHLSDVARREAERKAQDQKKNSETVDETTNSSDTTDPAQDRLLTKARREHPKARSDAEALAMKILDKEQTDVDRLDRVNDREDRMIAKLINLEQNLQQQIDQLKGNKEVDEHGGGIGPRQHWQDLMQERKLSVGDPITVTAPNEFEGKTGEIYDFSPSGSFVIVNLYNHGKHSMHLSDVEYNQYADDQEQDDWYDEEMEEGYASTIGINPKPLDAESQWKINVRQLIADYIKDPQALYRMAKQKGSNSAEAMAYKFIMHPKGKIDLPPDAVTFEGYQDFNRVEPYAVCLAGKPVKKFDYYEQARRFHDNWKQKLYREGDKAKADKITLMPLNLDEATNRHFGPKGAGTELARQIRANGDLEKFQKERNTPIKTSAEYINRQANANPGDPVPPPFGTKIQVKKNKGVAEGHTDQQRKVFKKNGEPVGEVGIDRESSPGNGQWYMKCYANGIDNVGYDSYEEAVAELKHCLKQGVAEDTGDNKFDTMMNRVKNDPWTQLNSIPNWEEGIEDLVYQYIQPFLDKMERSDISISNDGKTLNPAWKKAYEQISTQLAQRFLKSQKFNLNDPDLVNKIRAYIDWHTNELDSVAGQLSAYGKDLPIHRHLDTPAADAKIANMKDQMWKDHDDPEFRDQANPRRLDPGNMEEASNPAQQAAIAIAMKKAGKKPKQVDEAGDRVDPILIKALNRMPDGLASHGQVLDAAYDAYAMELGRMQMKSNYGTTNAYIPQLMALYKEKYGLDIKEEQKPLGFGEFPPKQEITIVPPKKLKSGQTYQDQNKYWQSQGQAPIYKTNEDTGSWIVYDPETKQIKKRFKTHTAGKSYARTHGLGFASSEFYFDRVKDNKEVAEGAMSNLHADLADVYNRMAPGIERNRDSFKAGQLYDALEAVAEQHGAEAEFKRMMAGARNRAHMDYDTNPGGFQNWFWYLPFAEEELSEEQDTSGVERAILNRIMTAHTDLLMKFGPEKVMQAAEEVAYNVGDVDEIGTRDVSAYVNQVRQILGVE